jgi:hypothetical protein
VSTKNFISFFDIMSRSRVQRIFVMYRFGMIKGFDTDQVWIIFNYRWLKPAVNELNLKIQQILNITLLDKISQNKQFINQDCQNKKIIVYN